MISVIIPSYRNPKYLDLCLHSLTRGQYNNNEIIVILDGYVEESEMVVNKYKGIDVIALPENKGMQHALNIGVWNANNERIFIINDDNVFAPNWDKKLESQYSPDEVLTINQIEPTGPGMFNFPVLDCGQTIETFDMEKFIDEERRLSVNKKTPDGNIFPFLINKKWYMAVGGFDTFYNSPNMCDWDFFAKLELIPTLTRARTHFLHTYHFGSVSTKKNAEAQKFREREAFAMQQYHYKWGVPPHNGKNNTKFPNGDQSTIRGLNV
jgi:glycosyltransferase involved in cell wall biosynthesis